MPSFEGLLLAAFPGSPGCRSLGAVVNVAPAVRKPGVSGSRGGEVRRRPGCRPHRPRGRRDDLYAGAVAAKHLLELGRARDLLDRVLARDPGDGEALLERGLVAAYAGDLAAAEKDLAAAGARRSDLLESVTLHRAWVALRRGDRSAAQRLFNEVEAPLGEQAPLRPGERRAPLRRMVPAGRRSLVSRRRRRAGCLGFTGRAGLRSGEPALRCGSGAGRRSQTSATIGGPWESRASSSGGRSSPTSRTSSSRSSPRCASRARFPAGAMVVKEGETQPDAYLIESGGVRIQRKTPYGQFSLAALEPGALFGETAFVDGIPRSGDAVTYEETELIALHPDALYDADGARPALQAGPLLGVLEEPLLQAAADERKPHPVLLRDRASPPAPSLPLPRRAAASSTSTSPPSASSSRSRSSRTWRSTSSPPSPRRGSTVPTR